MSRKFQELDLKDAFLFAAALEDEETCRLILQLILGFPIGRVKVHAEHSLLYSSDFRSVRLDIYASDETSVAYNLEMQNDDEKNLPKRSRYHQADGCDVFEAGRGYPALKAGLCGIYLYL